jgi:hypothetical protein
MSILKKTAGFAAAVVAAATLFASQASALVVGVAGGYGGQAGMATFLNANGHTATYFGAAAPNAAQLAGLDVLVLVRTPGNTDIQNWVLGGGALVTEWDSSAWALNTANLLDATDSGGGGIGTGTPITFTAEGVAAGLSAGLPNPYSDGGQTQFFRNLTAIGAGVDILGTRGAGIPVILGGASGLGSTLILGYDWQDGGFDAVLNSASEQILLNAVSYRASAVAEPGALALLGLGLAGLGYMRRRRAA